ncbi:MAG: VanZ family protein [Clostridia bacterium]|nr:VanZ family protein [Clostridia bacterium]
MNQIKYLLTRGASGWIYILPILVAYFAVLFVMRKRQKPLHIAAVLAFSFYLFVVVAATGIGNIPAVSFTPEIILIPLRDLIKAPMHFMLNVVAFVPIGVGLPLLYKKFCNVRSVALAGALFSLCIELLQMLGWGVTELDDLIANTLGACVGYWVYCLIRKCLPNGDKGVFRSTDVNDVAEVVLLCAGAFLIMAFVEPMI